jgi:hypothetical protein
VFLKSEFFQQSYINKYCRDFIKICYYKVNIIKNSFRRLFIDKGERAQKSAIASSKRKAIREIKKKRLSKLYRELRKARKK